MKKDGTEVHEYDRVKHGSKIPDSSGITTMQRERKYWAENYADKTFRVTVHTGGREIPITVFFPRENDHAYTGDIGTSQKKSGVRDLDPDRAAAMSRILEVIGRPKVRLSNYGADLMLERK